MSLLSMVFGNSPTLTQIGAMTLDASLKETHKRTATVAQSQIEDGSNIADHVKLDPVSLIINGVVSGTPVNPIETAVASLAGLLPVSNALLGLTGAASAITRTTGLIEDNTYTDENGNSYNRIARDAFKYLEALWVLREPIGIITGLVNYENMIIINLAVDRDKTTGDSLFFNIEMQQVRIVQSETVVIPGFKLKSGPLDREGQSSVNQGEQGANESSGGRQQSTLFRAYSSGRSFGATIFGGGG